MGRWTSKDPILFDARVLNLYGYAINDPINYIDVDGKSHKPGGPYHPSDGIKTKCLPSDSCNILKIKCKLLKYMIKSHQDWDRKRGVKTHEKDIYELKVQQQDCVFLIRWKCRCIALC